MHTQKQADIGRDKYELIAETIYGVTYYRLSDVAKKFNIKYATLYKRYQRGKRGDDLVKRKEKKGRTPYAEKGKYHIVANGATYRSAKEACRIHNVQYRTYTTRRDRGYSIEQALGIQEKPRIRKEAKIGGYTRNSSIIVNGVPYKNLAVACRATKQKYMTIRSRLLRGYTIEEAFSNPVSTLTLGTVVKVDTKTYNSVAEACRATKQNYRTIRSRLLLGYSIEEAIAKPVKELCVAVEVGDTQYKSIADAARSHKKDPANVVAALNSGVDITRALGLVTGKEITYEGVEYPTKSALFHHLNISCAQVNAQLKKGLTLLAAIDAVLKRPLSHNGAYTLNKLKSNPELANTISSIYLTRLNIAGKLVFKVGITRNKVGDRMKKIARDSDWYPVAEFNGRLIDCLRQEQDILARYSYKKYTIQNEALFDGHNELLDVAWDDVPKIVAGMRKVENKCTA